jgi:predicted small metal-binding protein
VEKDRKGGLFRSLSERKEDKMKVLACKDVGVDCDFQARGRSINEVLKKVSTHAQKYHNMKKVTKDYLDSWRMKIHDA